MVIRTPVGGGIRGGHYHSQSPESLFIHVAGLKVVCPSNPTDAKGLLLASIRDDDPVIFFEPKRVYRAAQGDVPEGDYAVPLGKAKVVRAGRAGHGRLPGARCSTSALEAAKRPPRSRTSTARCRPAHACWPLDIEADPRRPCEKTGRVVVVHEAPTTLRLRRRDGGDRTEKASCSCEAPLVRVTGFDTPFPYTLENDYLPAPTASWRRSSASSTT